jgi:flagellar biosynthesis/type III secretory pathway protein FliH
MMQTSVPVQQLVQRLYEKGVVLSDPETRELTHQLAETLHHLWREGYEQGYQEGYLDARNAVIYDP